MKKLLYFITFGLSVASFVYIFANSYLAVGIAFAVSVVGVILCFLAERKIKDSGQLWARKITYFFTKHKGDYKINQLQCTYICRDNKVFECEKIIEITSKSNDLKGITEHFRWSAFCNKPVIIATEKGHTISDLHQEDDWNCYFVDFNKVYSYNQKISTGSRITELHDPYHDPAPFFSFVATKKIKKLVITVRFPETVKPKESALFKVSAGEKIIGNPETIQYDTGINGFQRVIYYPRIGWKYMISWEQ